MTTMLAQSGSGIAGPPVQMRQKETVYWEDVPFADRFNNQFDAGSYQLKYAFAGPGPAPVTLTAAVISGAGGNGWRTTFDPTNAALMLPGVWWWQAVLTDIATGLNRIIAAEGQITVEPDLASLTSAFDGRSVAQKALDDCEAALATFGSGGSIKRYSIGGRMMEFQDITQIIAQRNMWKARVNAEVAKANGGDTRQIRVGFARPSSGSQVTNSKNWPWW